MPLQHEMFATPKLSLAVPPGSKGPRLWVRRLAIWESPGGEKIRDISLRPGLNILWSPDGLEEERRLMYVAITRAKKQLFLTLAQTRMLHGQTRYNVKSRFLDELPEEALKWLSPRVQHNWFGHHPRAAWVDAPEDGANQLSQSFSKKDVGWRIGENVMHPKFGEGVIVSIEGGVGNARASINFGRHGMKLLDLGIAKLEKVASS